MTGFAMFVDGDRIAAVSCHGRDVMHLSVHGDRTAAEFALAEVSGGIYQPDAAHQHLIWLNELLISPNSLVAVDFLDEVADSHAGRTIDELFPDKGSLREGERTVDEAVQDLKARVQRRERYTFHLSGSRTTPLEARTRKDDHSFNFSVLWNWKHPRRARVALMSHSVDEILERRDGARHAEFHIEPGDSVLFRVDG